RVSDWSHSAQCDGAGDCDRWGLDGAVRSIRSSRPLAWDRLQIGDWPACCLRFLLITAHFLKELLEIEMALTRHLFAHAVDFIENLVRCHDLDNHKIGRRANNRAAITRCFTRSLDASKEMGVVDMFAVPRQQKLESVNRSVCQVRRVGAGH